MASALRHLSATISDGFFDGDRLILRDHLRHHIHHHPQAADFAAFFLQFFR